jgi:hypothetical protein
MDKVPEGERKRTCATKEAAKGGATNGGNKEGSDKEGSDKGGRPVATDICGLSRANKLGKVKRCGTRNIYRTDAPHQCGVGLYDLFGGNEMPG